MELNFSYRTRQFDASRATAHHDEIQEAFPVVVIFAKHGLFQILQNIASYI